jgi:protein-tyrosine phosphatase
MAVKRSIRDVVWSVRGRFVTSPAPPANPRTLLFVCKGNICRSAFAGEFARLRLSTDLRCLSAGFRAEAGVGSPTAALEAAERRGVSLRQHRATPLTRALMDEADLVLVMEPWHVSELGAMYPGHRQKILLLSSYDPESSRQSAYERLHIDDPYGKSPETFDACFRRLERTITTLGQRTRVPVL